MYGVQFGMDGLSLDGTTWYNPKNNSVVKIKSNYFEDNTMKLQCDNGRIMTLEQLSDYVQWTGKGEPPKTPIQHTPTRSNELPPEVSAMLSTSPDSVSSDILPEDLDIIQGKNKRINIDNNPLLQAMNGIQTVSAAVVTTSANYNIIDRALNKTTSPSWDLSMNWNNFPKKEIELLSSVMDIPIDEIVDYYFDKMKKDFNKSFDKAKIQLQNHMEKMLKTEESSSSSSSKTTTTRKQLKQNAKQ